MKTVICACTYMYIIQYILIYIFMQVYSIQIVIMLIYYDNVSCDISLPLLKEINL